MVDSVRERVQAKAAEVLGGKWGLPAPNDERDLPFTSLDDGTETVAASEYDRTDLVMAVIVTRAARSTSNDQDELRKQANALHAEVIAELTADETLSVQGEDDSVIELADGVDYTGGGTGSEVGKFVVAIVNFNIRYHHVRGDPYTIEEE